VRRSEKDTRKWNKALALAKDGNETSSLYLRERRVFKFIQDMHLGCDNLNNNKSKTGEYRRAILRL